MERESRQLKKKRKPKMELNLKAMAHTFILNKIYGQETKIISYILEYSDFPILSFDPDGLTTEWEDNKQYPGFIRTHRYNGTVILQSVPLGMSFFDGVKFKSPYIKTE